ncbi:MAG: helix-turn-helix domain-containing protein [Clostridia bacterium]|nr:helix-turn-helix domain-containing protein [Clostridia bacterium]
MESMLFTKETEDLCKLFSEVSGILVTHLPEQNEIPFPYDNSLTIAHLSLAKDGLCRLVVPIFMHGIKKGVIASEPFFCLYPDSALVEATRSIKMQRSYLIISPARVEKTLSLLTRVITGKSDDWQLKKAEYCALISSMLKKESSTPLKVFLDTSLETIMMNNGDNFVKNKADCLRFVLMLHEFMQDNAMLYNSENWTNQRLLHVSSAQSIGQLKSCLDEATQEFFKTACQHFFTEQNQFIQKALNIVAQNYHKKITQNAVAHAVYLSPSYFSKLFKESIGCSFTQYVNQFRIEKAKALLENPNTEIDTVYSRVGYDDRSYFGKVFRELTDTTPKRYRDSLTL